MTASPQISAHTETNPFPFLMRGFADGKFFQPHFWSTGRLCMVKFCFWYSNTKNRILGIDTDVFLWYYSDM